MQTSPPSAPSSPLLVASWPLAATLLGLAVYLTGHGLYLYVTLPDTVLRDEDEHPIPGRDGTRRATLIRDARFAMLVLGLVLLGTTGWMLYPILRRRQQQQGLLQGGAAAASSSTVVSGPV